MRRTIILVVLLAVLCCAAQAEGASPVVRVGNITYDAAQVQSALDQAVGILQTGNVEMTDEVREQTLQSVLESFVVRGLAQCRIRELGLEITDTGSEYALREAGQLMYEYLWQTAREQYPDLTDKEISQLMTLGNYSPETCYRDIKTEQELLLLLEHYGVSTDVTDEELAAFYEEYYIAPYRERYEKNIPLFEEEVMYGEGGSMYIPMGYRIIDQIVLPIPEELNEKLLALAEKAQAASDRMQAAYDEAAEKALAGEDPEEARKTYAAQKAELEQMTVEYGRLWAQVLPAAQEQIDEIYARLNAGEAFASLKAAFSPDADSFPYHEDSALWGDEIRQAADTLKVPGDVSQPTLFADGVHILYYAEDYPGGAAEPGEEQWAIIREAASQNLVSNRLAELVSDWRDDYEIETDGTQLTF